MWRRKNPFDDENTTISDNSLLDRFLKSEKNREKWELLGAGFMVGFSVGLIFVGLLLKWSS